MKFSTNIISIALVICAAVYAESWEDRCPDMAALLKPCQCEDLLYGQMRLSCDGYKITDLVEIFENFSKNLNKTQKFFNEFELKNTELTEIKENAFKDLTFESLSIELNYKLTKIHDNAFGDNFNVTKKLYIEKNFRLNSPDHSIYATLAKFKNLQELYLFHNNLTEIPSHAFRQTTGQLDKLKILGFFGKQITKLGDYAFIELKNLEKLIIGYTLIVNITEYALAFDESNQAIKVDLGMNEKMGLWSFKNHSLAHFNRPTNLLFESTYLSESVFSEFMTINKLNTIDVNYEKFDCSSCYNFWLKKLPNGGSRIKHAKCTNKLEFEDSRNFPNCQ